MKIAPLRSFARNESTTSRACVVAIPVKNEAERLPACLRAFAEQKDAHGRPLAPSSFGVLIFANNCHDESAELARALTAGAPFAVRIVEQRLPAASAHAGGARRAAMDLAGAWLEERMEIGGVILTTDADSRVPPNWIAANLAAFDDGADAVLGRIALDEEGDLLPAALHRRGGLESAYEESLTELSALLDPLPHNPWPYHATISGASLGVTLEAYRRVGGLPGVPLGEDKALVANLLKHDALLRFASDITVVTSGRLSGRAPGGVADTLRLRADDPSASCDEALEPFRTAIRRAGWRGRLRRLHALGRLAQSGDWPRALGLSPQFARRFVRAPTFGRVWSAIEEASPLLERRRLVPDQLPAQIAGAQRALARLRGDALSARQHVKPEVAMAIPANDLGDRAHARDQALGSLVAG